MLNLANNTNKKKWTLNSMVITLILSIILGGVAGGIAGLMTATFWSSNMQSLLADWGWSQPSIVASRTKSDTQADDQSKPINNNAATPTKLTVEQIVAQSSPAVVSIVGSKDIVINQNNMFPFDSWFDFGWPFVVPQQPDNNEQPPQTQRQQIGAGSGFIISADGLILTNRHVVEDVTADYTVTTADGITYEATVLGRDTFNDLAIIKIDGKNLPVLKLGDSDKVQIGETVVAIGNALGEYSNTVTTGIVSGLGRDVVAGNGQSSEKLAGVIQTDAAINPGNSGGPLINMHGDVIGINTAMNSQGQLIGFALPINTAKQVVDSVKQYGRIVRPFLGVRYVMINDHIAQQNSLEIKYGALIARGQSQAELAVMPGSPADKAGLVENDIILEINDVKLDENNTLAEQIAKFQPHDIITLKVYHRGDYKTVKVELAEYQNNSQ
ncbi:MAG: S1C family serine protease [Candidatus Komeilibacteria bacterium]